jgi:hypothetical protein
MGHVDSRAAPPCPAAYTTGIAPRGRQLWEVLRPHAARTHSHACTSHPTWMPRGSNGLPNTRAGGTTAPLPSRGHHASTPLPRSQLTGAATGLHGRAAHRTARGAPAAPTQAGQSAPEAGLTRQRHPQRRAGGNCDRAPTGLNFNSPPILTTQTPLATRNFCGRFATAHPREFHACIHGYAPVPFLTAYLHWVGSLRVSQQRCMPWPVAAVQCA